MIKLDVETVLKRKLINHCIFVDDLTKLVEIGEYYDIIGLPKTDLQDDRITLAVEVGVVCKHDRLVFSFKQISKL